MSGTIEVGGKTYRVTLEEVTKGANAAPLTPESVPQMGGKKTKKAKKEKKASGTRKMNPYMVFAKKARQEVLAVHPELKSDVVAVGRKIGEKWRALSDAEKAKY